MKKVLIVCVLMAVLAISAQDQSASFGFSAKVESNDGGQMPSQGTKDAILENLKVLEAKYINQLPKRQYLEASMLIEEIRELLLGKTKQNSELNTQVNTSTETSQSVSINMNISGFDQAAPQVQAVEAPPKPVVEAVVVTNQPMNRSSFNQLVSNVEDEAFADDQMLYIRTAAKSHYFSVNQIIQLLRLFTFADEQLNCLRITYPKAVDTDNSFTIISHFTFEDDKKAAQAIISQ
jgi:Domain of unknown function (DUF4476)